MMNNKSILQKMLWYALVIAVIIPFIFPLVWIVSSSFKTHAEIVASPPVWLFVPTLDNYKNVFIDQDFGKFLWNSSVIAVGSTLLSLMIGLPAAYSISRYKQRTIGVFILLARVMPGISFLIPWFILFSKLGMIDTFASLIASHMMVGLPLIVWIMINYFDNFPRELEEAAQVDGCTLHGAFFRIVLPLAGPGILTASTLSFYFPGITLCFPWY